MAQNDDMVLESIFEPELPFGGAAAKAAVVRMGG